MERLLVRGGELRDLGERWCGAVALEQTGVDHERRRGEVDEDAPAGRHQVHELQGLGPGEAGSVAVERTVDEFAYEAAVQDELGRAWPEVPCTGR